MAEDILKGLDKIRAELEETRIALSAEEAKRAKIRQDYDKAKLEGDKSLQRSLNTDLMRIGKSLKGLSKSNENALEELSNYNSNSLKDLSDKLTLQKESLDFSKASSDLEKQLVVLNKDSNDNSLELARLFKDNMEILKDPELSEEQRKLALDQISEIQNLATSEEENREAQRLQKEANSRLLNMASNLESMGDKFDKFSDNFKKGAGLIGALGAIGLMLFSPETLYKIIDSVITFFDDMYKTITSIIDGDWGAGITFIKDHIVGVGVFIGGIAALFGGTILRAAGSLLRTVRTLGNVFGKLFLPFTVVLGLVGAITGFIEGFKEEGILGGIKGAITGLVNTLVAAPLDLLKDGVAWILGKFGFENAAEILESFSFSDIFSNMFGALFNIIGQAVDWVKSLFTFEEPEEGSFSLSSLIFSAIDKVKNLFMGIFDFLPSFSDIKEGLVNMMPSWMRGFISDDEPEEASVSDVAARGRARLAEARRDRNMITGSDELSVSRIGAQPQPAEIEAQPTAIPGAVLASTNQMMDNKAQAASQTNMTIIQASGGGGRSAPSNNSATANTYNISQGISSDDFVRRDFINGF